MKSGYHQISIINGDKAFAFDHVVICINFKNIFWKLLMEEKHRREEIQSEKLNGTIVYVDDI